MPRQLTDWISSFIEFSDFNTEPPRTYKEWTAISVIAAVLQRKCVLQWDTPIYPNMYIVLVGPPAARKGSAMRPGEKLLRDLGVTLASQAVTREALIRELKEAGSTPAGTLMDSDGNIHLHASLTVYSEELSVFLGHQNVILMADLANWFDCIENWTYRTKTQGVDAIVGIYVNLIGATTPEQIRTAMPVDLIGIGLSSRMIFVYEDGKEKVCAAPFISPARLRLREKLLADLSQIQMLSGEFKCTGDYIAKYTEWYVGAAQRPAFNDQRFSGYFERRSVHLRKLCMIVNASRSEDKLLAAEDFDRALEILTRVERKMPMTFMGFGKSPHGMLLINIVNWLKSMNRPVRRSELLQSFYRDLDLRSSDNLINGLSEMGLITVDYSKSDAIITARPCTTDLCELFLRGGF